MTELSDMPVAVTSRTFSKHPELRSDLLSRFSDVRFNDDGLSLAGDSLVEFLSDRQGAITGLERFDEAILSRLPNLKVISRFGVGVDMLDLAALERHGVRLAVTAGSNATSVAELAIALGMISLRGIATRAQEVRSAGKWRQTPGRTLRGQTVGLIGFGSVGREMARLCFAFGCEVLAFDPAVGDVPEHVQVVDLGQLLRRSDVVSLHVPLTDETRGLIGPPEFELMKVGAVIVNTSRGEVLDEAALAEALRSGRLGGAGLDVLVDEPPAMDHPLLALDTVFVTPHIGGSTAEAILATGRAAIDGVA